MTCCYFQEQKRQKNEFVSNIFRISILAIGNKVPHNDAYRFIIKIRNYLFCLQTVGLSSVANSEVYFIDALL